MFLLCEPIVCHRSGNHPSHCQPVSRVNLIPCRLFRLQTSHFTVLAIVQEKLNNPSPDDPYDADIAAVSSCGLSSSAVTKVTV